MTDHRSPTARLVTRWFVQYNPLYLVSAAAVLAGLYLISQDLSEQTYSASDSWISFFTEGYQLALIACAALLYRRRGLRRPAVMLALISVVYLCDLTFETQVAALHGSAGLVAVSVWLALTLLKVRALAWAMLLRLSRGAYAVIALGATSLVVMPQLLASEAFGSYATAAVGLLLFGIGIIAQLVAPRISSEDLALDAWGKTVLRRGSRATWAILAAGLLGHAVWWTHSYHLFSPTVPLAAFALLLAARARLARTVWGTVAVALIFAAGGEPHQLWAACLMAAVALTVAASRERLVARRLVRSPNAGTSPYRSEDHTHAVNVYQRHDAPMYSGAALLAYASLWLGAGSYAGGALPLHLLWLAIPLVVAGLVVGRWRRRVSPAFAAVALGLHVTVQRGLVAAPHSALGWGVMLLTVGVVALVLGVVVSLVFKGQVRAVE